MIRFFNFSAIIFFTLVLTGCTSIIAGYNLQAYKNATDNKAKSIALIELSDQPYTNHRVLAEKLLVDIDAAYEFAAGIKANTLSAKQWQIMRSKDRNLIGGYVEFWKTTENGVGTFFKNEAKAQISTAYDYIICLEANKKEATGCLK